MKKVFLLLTLLIVNYFGVLGQTHPQLVMPIGHTGKVYSADFSPDGRKILTASEDFTANVWDAGTWKLLNTLKGHTADVLSAQFSPNGKKIVTASLDCTTKVWDATTGKLLRTLKGHAGSVFSAEFSSDGKKIVTASQDNTAKVWDADTGKQRRTIDGHTEWLFSAQISPDGKKIVTVSCDSTDDGGEGLIFIPKVWDAITGKLLFIIKKNVNKVEFSPDGKKIVTAFNDHTAKIWDTDAGKLLCTLEGHTYAVRSAQFSPDGKKIVTASYDDTSKIWDADTGKLLNTLEGHTGCVESAQFSLDGKKIVTASDDHTAKVWDASTGKLLNTLEGHIDKLWSSEFSPDGKKIVMTSKDSPTKIWDANTGKLLNTLEGHTVGTTTAQISPDGKKIVTASKDNTAKVWDTSTGKLICTLKEHTDGVHSVQFSPDGKKIITASKDSTAKVWDVDTGKLLITLKGHTGYVITAQFSTNGKEIVTGSGDRTAKVWDANTGKLLNTIDGQTGNVNSAHFSPDGKRIVTAYMNNSTAKVWDAGTGIMLSTLEGHSAQFSPDGKKIVTVSVDKTAKVWDVGTEKLLNTLEEHNNNLWSAEFSPDGKKIVTITIDSKVKVWDADTGKLLNTIEGHTDWINSAQFSPDGKKIVTDSDDWTVKVWDAGTGKLLNNFLLNGNYLEFNFRNNTLISENNSILTLWDMETGEEKYSFIAIDSTDYLVFDKYYRYDGTPAARDYLYYVCGDEIIDLAQMKDALYVPGLVEKIMNGQEINYPKLADLEICDALPLIEQQEKNDGSFHYTITQRRLPLENVEVYVNDKLIQSIPGTTLKKQNQTYTLELNKQDLSKHYIPGAENNVKVVGVVKQNGSVLKSRGLSNTIEETENNLPKAEPNLYAVVIGINNYKDTKLQLNFPAIDAQDFGKALEESSKKLLGNDHVFLYQINSNVKGNNGYNTPEKESIRKALEEIGKKAKPEDVLLIFFAGHGVMQSNGENLFTFLTAETSENNRIGINTKELQSWLSYDGPNKMLVNKTILIFDACNSGQATKELLAMARNDDETQRIRQVEDLKDKSGMFILAASAPNQSAYELPQYGHGLLTYSLLYTLKNNPEVLDETKFLNVQKWFLETEKYLQQLVTSLGYNQNAQPFGTANIRIGEVDEKLKQNIQLGAEKPIVICSNVLNSSIFSDDLKLKELINQQLSSISERGVDTKIIFTRQETPNANSINIIYQTAGEDVICKVSLVKNKVSLYQNEISGKINDIDSLVGKIIEQVLRFAK